MRTIFNFALALVISCTLIHCQKDNEIYNAPKATEYIEIVIKSNGGVHTFAGNEINVILPPDEYNIQIAGDSLIARYVGETSATIETENTIYECKIIVEPAYSSNMQQHLHQRYVSYGTQNCIAYYGNAFKREDASIIVKHNVKNGDVEYITNAGY